MRLRLKALVVVLLVSLFVAVMIPCVYSRYIRGETLYYISKVIFAISTSFTPVSTR